MPISDAYTKTKRLHELQLRFRNQPKQRLRTPEVASWLGVSEDTARRYLQDLSGTGQLPLRKDGQFWVLLEGAAVELPSIHLDVAEAAALFVSGRLLSQIHDERNQAVLRALLKLVEALPPSLAIHQRAMIEMAQERQQDQPDRSAIFEVIAHGWTSHRKLRLFYAPPRLKPFECVFEPYLLEPSGIGRTIYVLGRSTPPGELRTFKLERITHAELLGKETFVIPEDFDGPALLKRAWGVMYGDEEAVEVHLRFSPEMEKRVKETLWHPSQRISDTPDGCEMRVQIGDLVEMENWIRGWGADCEVLAPQALRESMMKHARRLAHMYGVAPQASSTPDDEPDLDFFSHLYGGE